MAVYHVKYQDAIQSSLGWILETNEIYTWLHHKILSVIIEFCIGLDI